MRSIGKKHSQRGPFGAVLASLIVLFAMALVIDSALSEAGEGQIPCDGNNYADDDYVVGPEMGGTIVVYLGYLCHLLPYHGLKSLPGRR